MSNYGDATKSALQSHEAVFQHLAKPANEKKVLQKMTHSSIFESARLAAGANQQKRAVDLLLLWLVDLCCG